MSFIVCVCSLFMFVWTEVYLHRNCLFACINVPVIDFLWNRGGWMQEVLLSIGISVGRWGLRLVLQLLGWVDHISLSPASQPRIMHLILQKRLLQYQLCYINAWTIYVTLWKLFPWGAGNQIKKGNSEMGGVVGTQRIHPNHHRHCHCHHSNVRPYLGITWPRFSGCPLSPRFRLYQP